MRYLPIFPSGLAEPAAPPNLCTFLTGLDVLFSFAFSLEGVTSMQTGDETIFFCTVNLIIILADFPLPTHNFVIL